MRRTRILSSPGRAWLGPACSRPRNSDPPPPFGLRVCSTALRDPQQNLPRACAPDVLEHASNPGGRVCGVWYGVLLGGHLCKQPVRSTKCGGLRRGAGGAGSLPPPGRETEMHSRRNPALPPLRRLRVPRSLTSSSHERGAVKLHVPGVPTTCACALGGEVVSGTNSSVGLQAGGKFDPQSEVGGARIWLGSASESSESDQHRRNLHHLEQRGQTMVPSPSRPLTRSARDLRVRVRRVERCPIPDKCWATLELEPNVSTPPQTEPHCSTDLSQGWPPRSTRPELASRGLRRQVPQHSDAASKNIRAVLGV